MIKSKYVTTISVIDPDSNAPVDIEVRKMETGPMVGIDASWLEQDVGHTYSPYDRNTRIDIPDDEGVIKQEGSKDEADQHTSPV